MTVHAFGYAVGNGAGNMGCADGPTAIQQSDCIQKLAIPIHWEAMLKQLHQTQGMEALPDIQKLCTQLAAQTYACTQERLPFVTIGGDHSCAIGTWSGAAAALRERGDLGLIWFDAHMDSHTPETTPSNNIHGMPLATLLGYGERELTDIFDYKPKLKPENLVLIGVRSYEKGEAELLKKLGVKVFFMENINHEGFVSDLQTAIDIVTEHTVGFGISIDLDGLDPAEAPGVGSPVAHGVHTDVFLAALHLVGRHQQFVGAEIAELNPHLDQDKKTEKISCEILQALFESSPAV